MPGIQSCLACRESTLGYCAQHAPKPERVPVWHAYRCPVCEGRGTVQPGFYSGLPSMGGRERCQSCDPQTPGVIWSTR